MVRLASEATDRTGGGDKGAQAEGLETASTEEVLLLVDAANGFNNLSRYGML